MSIPTATTAPITGLRKISATGTSCTTDGVVVSDLDLILGFDAMLLEDIDIYDQAFFVGKTPFQGLVNFITRKTVPPYAGYISLKWNNHRSVLTYYY